jgi:predicted outer membrane repeat protein
LRGGGVYLEVSAKLNILIVHENAKLNVYYEDFEYGMHTSKLSLLFTSNLAGEHGGAVYVADETDSGTCNATMTYSSC